MVLLWLPSTGAQSGEIADLIQFDDPPGGGDPGDPPSCIGEGGGETKDITENDIYWHTVKTCVVNTNYGGQTCVLTREEHTYHAVRGPDGSWTTVENSYSSSAAACV